jgi:hypothetical protein
LDITAWGVLVDVAGLQIIGIIILGIILNYTRILQVEINIAIISKLLCILLLKDLKKRMKKILGWCKSVTLFPDVISIP